MPRHTCTLGCGRRGSDTGLHPSPAPLSRSRRVQRGDPEPIERGASGLGRHYDIGGGRAEYGPTDTERNAQVDERDIPARVP